MSLHAPAAIAAEHHELHAELERAIGAGGTTGAAAREVARLLHGHFVKEEAYAMPPLSLLGKLSRGEYDPSMLEARKLTDQLEAELPQMLAEHSAIVQALNRLSDAADSDGLPDIVRFCDKLIAHAKMEEEILYPAALLVGRQLKAMAPIQGG
ncbi:MAG: hypothetical protein K2Y29_13805 [Beijerinckiaceae bacterium]|nr:hypothetical protein [Beijerinckiaceae bacterium]